MNALTSLWRSAVGKLLFAVPISSLLLYYGVQHSPTASTETAGTPISSNAPAATSTYSPRPAGDITKTFVVKSSYRTSSGLVLLNDSEDFRDPKTLSVAVNPNVKGVPADVAELIGKTVVVTGYQTQYKGRPQIGARSFAVK